GAVDHAVAIGGQPREERACAERDAPERPAVGERARDQLVALARREERLAEDHAPAHVGSDGPARPARGKGPKPEHAGRDEEGGEGAGLGGSGVGGGEDAAEGDGVVVRGAQREGRGCAGKEKTGNGKRETASGDFPFPESGCLLPVACFLLHFPPRCRTVSSASLRDGRPAGAAATYACSAATGSVAGSAASARTSST